MALAGIPPAIPAGLCATTTSSTQVSLSWFASPGATGYNLKRATNSAGPYTTMGTVTTADYLDSGIEPSVTYFYVVSAVNGGVESANSAPVSAPLRFSALLNSSAGPVVSGWGGVAGQSYYVLASTNLALPRNLWTRIATNSFGTGGYFSFTGSLSAGLPQQFYGIQLPQ